MNISEKYVILSRGVSTQKKKTCAEFLFLDI